ncbi:MAG TPA: hypothetical protein VHA37_06910 [Candidatus Saccharimonadales bacterium]|nr:hypothetical protein [Candidatus Saccharimonadales bacterium]
MEIEHTVKVFCMDADFEAHVRKMTEEGWMLLPGIPPVAIYHCVRMNGAPDDAPKPTVKVAIDDSKVHVLRNGVLIEGT